MAKLTVSAALELAQSYVQAGYWAQAETVCRALAAAEPTNPWVENLLGAALQGQGRLDDAAAAYRRVVELAPQLAVGHYNLAVVLEALGRPAEARRAYEAALAADSRHPAAWNNLGLLLHAGGDVDQAAAALEQALEWRPKDPTFRANLAGIRLAQGRLADAEQEVRTALVQAPGDPSLWNTLGQILRQAAQPQAAEAALRQALSVQPDFAQAANNLGLLLHAAGRLEEAELILRRSVATTPHHGESWASLATVLLARRRYADAEAACRQALAINPGRASTHNTLAVILRAEGDAEAAHAAQAAAWRLAPESTVIHSNLLLGQQYRAGVPAADLLQMHLEWGRRHAAAGPPPPIGTDRPAGPLRVGFASSGFCRHPVGQLVAPLLEALRPRECQTFCYATVLNADEITQRIRAAADATIDITHLDDERVAQRIRDDAIDVLLDLDGHTTANRLPVFARKPAAVQITWFAYPGTTGLAAMDYLLADRWHVPPEHEPFFRERVLRMPHGYACFAPPADAPPVGPLPAERNGFVTLGCFNNPAKLSDETLAAWAEILRRVPGTRLLLAYAGCDGPRARERITAPFAAAGVAAERLELRGWMPQSELWTLYGQVDLALDPWPYSGGVTTCEALWMGVPVLTRPGLTLAGRHAFSHLSTVGLPQFIAADVEAYIARAVELAGDLTELRHVRSTLRAQMAASPLCDVPGFAADFLELLESVAQRSPSPSGRGPG